MEELIQFRSTIDTLSHTEFLKFIESRTQSFWANFIFQRFYDKLKILQDLNKLNHIIQDIRDLGNVTTEILRARENKKTDQDLSNTNNDTNNDTNKNKAILPIKIDNLPNVLISHISSFLTIGSMLRFEKSNRAIFIGTRSPSSLQIMALKTFERCWRVSNKNKMLYHWIRFKSIKQLTLNIDTFFSRLDSGDSDLDFDEDKYYPYKWIEGQYGLWQLPIWHNLKVLHFYHHHVISTNFSQFVDDHLSYCNISNIEQISNVLCGHDLSKDCAHFQNLKCLNIAIRHDVFDKNKNFIASLKGISLKSSVKFINEKIKNFAAVKMESYHQNEDVKLYGSIKFDNLKEVCLANPQNIDFLFNHNANYLHLQRVHLKMKNVLHEIDEEKISKLFEVDSLNYICVDTNTQKIINVLNILNKSLFISNISRKSRLKMRIICNEKDKRIHYDITNQIFMILNNLNAKYSQFMLICNLLTTAKYNDLISKFVEEQKDKFIIENIIKETKKPNDFHHPKQPKDISAIYLFANERGSLLRKMYCAMTISQIRGLIKDEWNSLDPMMKKPYDDLAAANAKKYKLQIEEYKKTEQYRNYQQKVKNSQGFYNKFVISTKQNTFNGYQEKWTMCCPHCKQTALF